MFSVVLIVPSSLRDQANMLGQAMGWGPGNYSVALYQDITLPASHYGLHAWAQQEFIDILGGVAQGVVPPVAGLAPQEVVGVVSSLVVSIRPDASGHWQDVIEAHGLTLQDTSNE